MTIRETEYDRSGYNMTGDRVSERELLSGTSVPVGEIAVTDVFPLPNNQLLIVPGGRAEMEVHVLTRHPKTGQDRVSITPGGRILTGDEINQANLVFSSRRPGVTHIGITSTPNPSPTRKR